MAASFFPRLERKGFEDPDVRKLPGSGLISSGGFATAIKNVFLNNVSTIRFHGIEEILGRRIQSAGITRFPTT